MSEVLYPVTLTLVWCMIGWLSSAVSEAASRGGRRGHVSRPLSDEEMLLDRLFSSYNPAARPVMNSSGTVSVKIQFSLMHIKELDVRSQILTTTGLLILEWRDERLTWTPSEHNNMEEIIIESEGLWTPEFAVINGAEKIYEDYDQFRAVVSHRGMVHWEPGGVFKTMCPIDITYYPFDEQQCVLTFGAWSYHTQKMNLTNFQDQVNLDSYNENGEWNIYHTMVQRNEFAYECCPDERFANVAFRIYLRRRHTFYILNVILPSIMTSVLLLSVFFCTPGQKVQIGVVVLLSFRIFLLNVTKDIPKTSDHIPLLGIYLTCTMAITTLSMVLTVFVLNLHHVTDRPVPPWARKLVFIYLARMLGMCASAAKMDVELKATPQTERRRQPRPGSAGAGSGAGFFRRSYTGLHEDTEETAAIIELQNRNLHNHTATDDREGGSPWVLRNARHSSSPYPQPPPAYDNHVTPRRDHHAAHAQSNAAEDNTHQSKKKNEDHAAEWRRMAEIFDRLFFWLFLFAIVSSTLVLFHPLTKSYIVQIKGDT